MAFRGWTKPLTFSSAAADIGVRSLAEEAEGGNVGRDERECVKCSARQQWGPQTGGISDGAADKRAHGGDTEDEYPPCRVNPSLHVMRSNRLADAHLVGVEQRYTH